MKIKSSLFILSLSAISFTACNHKSVPSTSVPAETQKSTVAVQPTETSVKPTDAEHGQKVYEASCGRCHGLKNPSEFTVSEWRPIMNSMSRKANLTASDKADVLAYVIKNAKSAK